MPPGAAATASGGHRLNGKWSFASGADYAHWFLLAAVVKDDGPPQERMFLVPASQVELVDDWHVMGLAGTGSKSVVLKDVHVAATHSVSLHDLKHGTAPGALPLGRLLRRHLRALRRLPILRRRG